MESGDDFLERADRNMANNKAFAAKLMAEFKSYATTIPSFSMPGPIRRVRKPRMTVVDRTLIEPRRNPSRRARTSDVSNDSSDSRFYSEDSVRDENAEHTGKKFVLKLSLGGGRDDNNNNDDDDDDDDMRVYDDEDEENFTPSGGERRRSKAVNVYYDKIVTENEIALIAPSATGKIYNQIRGTSCHQCRQKTLDTKTVCRSDQCVGIRGMFCGPCLKNRYGEEAADALRDKDWTCPPCRGICNCSICRRRLGKNCTGILVHIARENGFNDVNSYLQNIAKPAKQ